MKKLNFGVLGLGVHGTRYANHLRGDVPNGRLLSVCRRNEELGRAYAEEHGVKFFADYHELLADEELDIAVVVTHPEMHLPVVEAAAEQGKHVLVEKPMARTVAEAGAIIAACERAGVRLMVAQTTRFNPLIQELKKRLPEFGRLVEVVACQRQEPPRGAWQSSLDLSGGGSILETGVHLFDAIRYLTEQDARQVYCAADRFKEEEVEDLFTAHVTLTDGTRCLIDACKYTESRLLKFELIGEKGQLIASLMENRLYEIHGREVTELPTPPPIQTLPKLMESFATAILEQKPVPITGMDGLKAVEIAMACYRSSQSDTLVTIGVPSE